MRIASALSSSHFRKGPLLHHRNFVVGAFAAYLAAEYVVRGDFTKHGLCGQAIVGGAIVIGILKTTGARVYFFLFWLLLEDFVRKYLGNNMAIYFVKDFLALVVLISFLAAYRRRK